jgi:hypothetical protein
VEAMGLEPTNLLTASQALYQLSYAPVACVSQVTGCSPFHEAPVWASMSAHCQRFSAGRRPEAREGHGAMSIRRAEAGSGAVLRLRACTLRTFA